MVIRFIGTSTHCRNMHYLKGGNAYIEMSIFEEIFGLPALVDEWAVFMVFYDFL